MAGTGRHDAVHRTMVLVDVEGFGVLDRTLRHQQGTRAGLYEVVGQALAAAGVPWDACYHEDRGDSVVVLVPPEFPKAPLVEVLPEALVRAVRGHNTTSPGAARVRLRLAVHAGEVAFDGHGVTSTALTDAFRLLDAPALKTALKNSPGVVAMIVSDLIHRDVVRHCATLDPGLFRRVEVEVKQFHDTAWIALPDQPHPPAAPGLPGHPLDPTTPTTPPDVRPATGTDRDRASDGGTGTRGVHIAGGVHGAGAGITIGAATGDHVTIGHSSPPPGPSAGPPPQDPR
ncbi:hypothetical protein [Saccharothrix syringae]|uniref:Guanylate cyclase domain-containing protein n=1 Tax=Saccharothrix syringae TaxID=103733 RepID=A0A5Q0H3V8_SACSY|nr:hypothetical protein [Saccharothrix syringae]QFZ20490.1 hypothetical protein EKG83_26525 [Saccharothrix syringae]